MDIILEGTNVEGSYHFFSENHDKTKIGFKVKV